MTTSFDEPTYARQRPATERRFWLTALILRTGLFKREVSVQVFLLIVALGLFILVGVIAVPSVYHPAPKIDPHNDPTLRDYP